MKKLIFMFVIVIFSCSLLVAQIISFGLGDLVLEASLNDMSASAKLDIPGFATEISLQWGVPKAEVELILQKPDITGGEVYLAAALAEVSGKPISAVVETYQKDKTKGWGALAKELGIKPGSKEFKALKDKSSSSAAKTKGKKK